MTPLAPQSLLPRGVDVATNLAVIELDGATATEELLDHLGHLT